MGQDPSPRFPFSSDSSDERDLPPPKKDDPPPKSEKSDMSFTREDRFFFLPLLLGSGGCIGISNATSDGASLFSSCITWLACAKTPQSFPAQPSFLLPETLHFP